MDKKKLIKSLLAIIANLAALIAIYFNVHPSGGAASADSAKKDSTSKVVLAKKADSLPAPKGLLSKLVKKIKTEADSEAVKLKKKDGIAGKLLNDGDSLLHRIKKSITQHHLSLFSRFKHKFRDSLKRWDEMQQTDTAVRVAGKFKLKKDVQVYGFHPYWVGSAYKTYNYSLLSTISYFSYEVNPNNGLPVNTMTDWTKTAIRDSCKKYGVDLHLTASCMGEDDNRNFLNNATAQETFINEITSEINEGQGDGVCLDFEALPASLSSNFVTLVKNLRKEFEQDFKIVVCLPAIDWAKAYDVQSLSPYVDNFIVMGYDFYGSWSSTSGPVAPLRSSPQFADINLEKSVSYYLGLGVPNNKLLLALPYYGAQWVTENNALPSDKIEFVTSPTYRQLHQQFGTEQAVVDSAVVSAINVANGTGGVNQYWFDNAATLGEKYQFALDQKIGGVGIWALGYDNGYPELWNVLCTKMAQPGEGVPPDTLDRFPRYAFARDSSMTRDTEWGVVGANGSYLIFDNVYTLLFTAMFCFFVIVLIQVVLDQDPWNELFTRRMVGYLLTAFTAVIMITALGVGWFFSHEGLYAILTGVFAGYLIFRLTQRIVGKKDKLP